MKYAATLGLLCLGLFNGTGLAIAPPFTLGSQVTDFSVVDVSGNPASFQSLKGDTTVVVFVSAQCPVSNAYNARMNAVYRDYSSKGVKFLFVNSNATEAADAVAAHARSNFAFPVYRDPNNVVADLFGAQVTPETFVIDRTGAIRFHGAIDDSRDEARVGVRGLRNALDAVIGGNAVAVAESKAFGCSIKRARK